MRPDAASEPPPPPPLLEHTRALAARMQDRRFYVELLVELSAALGARSEPERKAGAKPMLDEAEALLGTVTSAEDREIARGRVAVQRAIAGQADPALALARAMRSGDERTSVLVRIGLLAADAGERARAEELARELPPAARAEVDAAIVRHLVRKGDLRGARRLADGIEGGHSRSVAFGAIAIGELAKGGRDRAETSVRAIESAWIQARTWADLAQREGAAGRVARRDELLQKARATADGIKDAVMRSAALEDLADRALAQGRMEDVKALAGACPTSDARSRILAKIVVDHVARGRVAEAEALARGGELTDPIALADALSALATARARAGEGAAAMEIVAAIPSLQLRLGPLARVVAELGPDTPIASSVILSELEQVLEVRGGAPKR